MTDYPILQGNGRYSRDHMKQIAEARYEEFDTHRRSREALEADAEDVKELEDAANILEAKKPRSKKGEAP
jgi:hypothetical protein